MEHLNIVTTLIIMVVLIYAVVKQFMAKPIKWFGFLIFPMLALYEAYHSYTAATVTAYQNVECAVMVTLALIAAVIQALFTEVFYKDSQLYMRSKIVAVITWVLYIMARITFRVLFNSMGLWMMWLGIAVIFSVRSIILYIRFPEIGHALMQHSGRRRRQSRRL